MWSNTSLVGRYFLRSKSSWNEAILISNGSYLLKFVNNPVLFKSNRQIKICLLLTKNNCLLLKKSYVQFSKFSFLWILYQAPLVSVNLSLWEWVYFSAPDIPSYHIKIPGRLKTKFFLFFFLKLS